jgi:Ca2+-binding EF-hand superfamily protein
VQALPARRRDELSPDELAEVSEAYRLFDTEDAGGSRICAPGADPRPRLTVARASLPRRAGAIGYLELKCCIRALDFEPSKDELAKLVQEFDRALSGQISRDAFIEIMSRLYADKPAEERLAQAFALFDESGTGMISRRDLKRVCREVGVTVEEDELQVMIDEFDTDADGQLNLEDFRAVLSEAMLGGF